ncbi:MAG: PhzF family phenazine biosynthesis protein [Alphaproteobacteria bacterium]|nr:MAG: PhzF family phenazine biosynthesis protein [Alphaproteobacteria bacterium]
MRRRFVTLDVFTDKRFAGNPLAVVLEPDGLDSAAMQAIAREFNLSETVFVFPSLDKGNRAKIRIFTPVSELPFAGHPTVGTAVLLGQLEGEANARDFVLELNIGLVACKTTPNGADGGRAVFDLPRLPAEIGAPADNATLAAALGLEVGDIGSADLRPARWSAGAPYSLVPMRGLDAIRRCRVNPALWDKAFGFDAHAAAYMFCRETMTPGYAFHTRMFAPHQGVPEDPATGSAAAAFAGYLSVHGDYQDGEHLVRIEQGFEMGRPSLIDLTLNIGAGKLVSASIGGSAVIVTEGTIEA